MLSLKKDTLAYQSGYRPGVLKRDMGAVSLPTVVGKLNAFMDSHANAGLIYPAEGFKGNPEVDALKFYMLNHATTLVSQRLNPLAPLGKYQWIMETYHEVLAGLSARMFYYMLLICTRESRHAKDSATGQLINHLQNKYGAACTNFWASIKGTGSGSSAEEFRKSPPATTLGAYTRFLSELFHQGMYSNGYGGKAWGAVADVLRDFSIGVISAEMMMDTSFTLCHNNGPIFNKGMLFDTYTHEIYKILDVQRSGQVPQYVGNKEGKWKNNPEVNMLWERCHHLIGHEFSGYVDWYKVEELGSLHKYPNEKKAQLDAYGYPESMKALKEIEEAKKAMEAKKAAIIAAEVAKKWVQVMPTLKVEKVKVR